ncbi:MAG TPA: hypothetical protein QF520_15960, partial [SAR202 cluster bacterium]|nr:hypothetical protein [SAR202 cluster bacterium]
FDWDGQHWPGASVEYNVNLKNSGDDGGFLSAIQPQRKLGSTTPVQPSQPDGRQQRRHVGRPK